MSVLHHRRATLGRALALESMERRRLLSAALDPAFGNGGVVSYDDGVDVFSEYLTATSAVGADGKIVSAAEFNFVDNTIVVRRFNADGSADSTFDGDGAKLLDLGTNFDAVSLTDLAIGADNSIYLAGEYNDPTAGFIDVVFVTRLLSDGQVDTGYGNSAIPGLATINPSGAYLLDPHLALTPSSLYVAYAVDPDSTGNNQLGITRLDAAGEVDGSFANLGTLVTDIPGTVSTVKGLFAESGGLIVVGDTFANIDPVNNASIDKSIYFASVDYSGVLDAGFGDAGFKLTLTPDEGFVVNGAAPSPTGYVVGGNNVGLNELNAPYVQAAFFSFDANFDLDASFGDNGVYTTALADNLSLASDAFSDAVAVDANGFIYGAGLQSNPTTFSADLIALRLTPAGALDATFDGDGVVVFDQTIYDAGTSVTIAASGGALVTGINAAPSATLLQFLPAVVETPNTGPFVTSVTGPASVDTNVAANFDAVFGDLDLGDTLEVSWDFGDGTVLAFAPAAGTSASASHTYLIAGSYTVTFTVRDAAGATATGTTALTVTTPPPPVPYTLLGGSLSLTGSSGNDTIRLAQDASGQIVLTYNGTPYVISDPVTSVVLSGGAGNDLIRVESSVSLDTTLIGGDGNDSLRGAGGDDIILGDAGNDVIVGGAGRDLLVGGIDADDIAGNVDQDILVSGTTTYSTDPVALSAIKAEWTSNKSWAVRVANISGLSPQASRLNGNYFLTTDVTVFSDASIDTLAGGAGTDMYYATLWGSQSDLIRDNLNLSEALAALLLGD
jgi:uncharacterized delta-60 repeat protein